jgi:hypothetical protein
MSTAAYATMAAAADRADGASSMTMNDDGDEQRAGNEVSSMDDDNSQLGFSNNGDNSFVRNDGKVMYSPFLVPDVNLQDSDLIKRFVIGDYGIRHKLTTWKSHQSHTHAMCLMMDATPTTGLYDDNDYINYEIGDSCLQLNVLHAGNEATLQSFLTAFQKANPGMKNRSPCFVPLRQWQPVFHYPEKDNEFRTKLTPDQQQSFIWHRLIKPYLEWKNNKNAMYKKRLENLKTNTIEDVEHEATQFTKEQHEEIARKANFSVVRLNTSYVPHSHPQKVALIAYIPNLDPALRGVCKGLLQITGVYSNGEVAHMDATTLNDYYEQTVPHAVSLMRDDWALMPVTTLAATVCRKPTKQRELSLRITNFKHEDKFGDQGDNCGAVPETPDELLRALEGTDPDAGSSTSMNIANEGSNKRPCF